MVVSVMVTAALTLLHVPSSKPSFFVSLYEPGDIGALYQDVRRKMVARGDVPIPGDHACSYGTDICDVFPELDSCAVDVLACVFTWKSKDGSPLYVQTEGDTLATLRVDYVRDQR